MNAVNFVAQRVQAALAETEGIWTLFTSARNRYGFKVDPLGMEISGYKANPVVFFNHDTEALPIGNIIPSSLTATENAMTARIAFYEGTELGRNVKQAIDANVLRAGSIGFLIKQWEYTDPNADPDEPYVGQDVTITKSELLEYSIVGTPADPMAVVHQSLSKTLAIPTRPALIAPEPRGDNVIDLAQAIAEWTSENTGGN